MSDFAYFRFLSAKMLTPDEERDKDEIIRLKSRDGRDMVVYGGASFDSSLIKLGLIDEFLLFINPVAIGNGMTIFRDLNEIQKFNMVKSIAFDCGIVLLHYEARKA